MEILSSIVDERLQFPSCHLWLSIIVVDENQLWLSYHVKTQVRRSNMANQFACVSDCYCIAHVYECIPTLGNFVPSQNNNIQYVFFLNYIIDV